VYTGSEVVRVVLFLDDSCGDSLSHLSRGPPDAETPIERWEYEARSASAQADRENLYA